jgi:hypothetical protein
MKSGKSYDEKNIKFRSHIADAGRSGFLRDMCCSCYMAGTAAWIAIYNGLRCNEVQQTHKIH